MPSFLALSSLASLASLAYARQWSIGQSIKATNGEIKGHPSSWKPNVSEYLGIPYAQPPVGNLRWTPPKPVNTSNERFEASKFSASCLPNINMTPNGTITYGSFKKTLLGVVGQVEGSLGHRNGLSNLTNQSINFRHV
jgi:carboxylesterase family protein